MEPVLIRHARMDDYLAWRATYAKTAAEGRWIGGEQAPPDDRMRARFRSLVEADDQLMLVAEVNSAVVGGLFCEMTRGVGHIGMLLAGEFRGRGLGRRLLSEAIAWAQDTGAHKLALEVWPHNQRAIALYEACGFVHEGRLIRHYRRSSGELWDALMMGLVLDHHSPGSSHPEPAP